MTVRIYKIEPHKVTEVRQAISADHWARNGYTLRSGKGMDIDVDDYFLYVKADDKFFSEHEKEVLVEGVSRLDGDEFERVKAVFDLEDDNVASGIALFE